MWKDPIVEAIRAYRDEHSRSFQYDADAILPICCAHRQPMRMLASSLLTSNRAGPQGGRLQRLRTKHRNLRPACCPVQLSIRQLQVTQATLVNCKSSSVTAMASRCNRQKPK